MLAAIGLALIIWMTTLSSAYASAVQEIPFAYSAPLLWLILMVLLPRRFMWLSIPLGATGLWLLSYLNDRKIAAIELPMTYFDLRLALSEPAALANALGFAGSSRLIPAIVVVGLAAMVAALLLRRRLRRSTLGSRQLTPWRWRACAAALIACIGTSALVRYAHHVRSTLPQTNNALWLDLWIPETQAGLSRTLGLPEYLAFSWLAELPIEIPAAQPEMDDDLLSDVVGRYVKDVRIRSMLPNVVLFHAESTFDPNRAFRLTSPIRLPLWSGVPKTRAIGPLRVNIVGGGSWVTDFEVMTGVDTRLFGFQGYYTTYYVAPMVRYSLPIAASMLGYATKAFSTVSGETYNYRNAFRHYGFAEFIDGVSLGMSPDWSTFKDEEFVGAIIRSGAFSGHETTPFFYYIDTTENHGPHPCRAFTSPEQLVFSYADNGDFDQNCQLNEYVRRAESTSAAFERLLEQLDGIESRTGRPYVLLAYGDHQPWDFTDGLYSAGTEEVTDSNSKSLSAFRTSASLKETFFHVVASEADIITHSWHSTAPPATLLPTLLSAFMTSRSSELYMPENLALDQYCGPDIVVGCDRAYLAHQTRSRLLSPPR